MKVIYQVKQNSCAVKKKEKKTRGGKRKKKFKEKEGNGGTSETYDCQMGSLPHASRPRTRLFKKKRKEKVTSTEYNQTG